MGKKIELEKEFIEVENSFLELKNSNVSDSEKLDSINGGGKSFWYLLGAGLSFLLGFISGFINPVKCN